MSSRRFSLEQAAFVSACGSALAILFSIAVSHILLAVAFALLLMSGTRLRFPPIKLPLALFIAGTLISLALSPDPWGGRPQLRKFYVFLTLLVIYSTGRTLERVRAFLMIATGLMTMSALWSLVQFVQKYEQAKQLHRAFYEYYVSERITGFMSHWMTLGGQEMIVILMAAALVLFSTERKWRWWLLAGVAVIFVSLLLGFTRSIWFGTFCGGIYLLWRWRRWWVLAAPVPILALLLIAPVRERAKSAFQPHGDTDSNEFRRICRAAGWQMIKAHPWFGLGPEQVKAQLTEWIPPEIPRPLPAGWYGHLHNIYFQYAAERGIPTALMLMWLLGKMLWDFARALRRTPPDAADTRAILEGAIAVMIGMLVVGFYEVNLGDTEVLQFFLAVVACGYVAVDFAMKPEAARA